MTKYKSCFTAVLEISENEVNGLQYQDVPSWDSVGHMMLIASLEKTFNIKLSMDDVVDFTSFEKGIEILGKYGIKLDN
ncbi:acyl carrier protein [Helicobacter felis]|uniref:Acyl carrier protein n=1 Tax=Helicobacter felis (strain ATCC 49179 / CCUG 28539 / NCTC 12436 / CS1) TaxID=936155 RepID=E7ABW8_HELFC|nr:acyl carrier protein [Helicobacter felis]CBY82091.1 Acyl carrier protein [Helicobacter felis ATCC 49179]